MRVRSPAVLLLASSILLAPAVGCGGPTGESPTEPALAEPGASLSVLDSAAAAKDRYDDSVLSVDTVGSSFTLGDGTVVQTTPSTRWKSGGNRIVSLAGMADALSAGFDVVARGKGTETAPSMITAEDVDAQVERGSVDTQRFAGPVASSDGTTFVLEDGTEVSVNAASRWKTGPDRLTSMQQVADAVDTGLGVRARGRGVVQPDSTLLATQLDVRVRESSTRRFAGVATAADPTAGTITLGDSRVILVTTATSWKGGPRRLGSLEELEVALLAGASVRVKGKGVTQADDSIAAAELDVRFRSSDLTRFRGNAASVDLVAGTVSLENGIVVTVFEGTRWRNGLPWLSSLEQIADALAASETVTVFGKGTLVDPTNILAARIRAKVMPDED